MVFVHDINKKTLFIVLFQCARMDASRINKFTNIPLSTIYRWINQTKNDENIFLSTKGPREDQTLSPTIKKKVVRKVREQPARSSTRKIGDQLNIGKSSVERILIEKNFNYGSTTSVKTLTEDKKKERVSFCKDMIKRKGDKLKQTIFTDEMGMDLADAYPRKAWSQPYKKIKYEKPEKNVRMNCWAGLSVVGATSL